MQSHKDHRHHTAACFNNMGTAFDSDVFSVYIIQCAMTAAAAAAAIAIIIVVAIFFFFLPLFLTIIYLSRQLSARKREHHDPSIHSANDRKYIVKFSFFGIRSFFLSICLARLYIMNNCRQLHRKKIESILLNIDYTSYTHTHTKCVYDKTHCFVTCLCSVYRNEERPLTILGYLDY